MSNLFISHSTKDKEAALALKDWLEAKGYQRVFIDSHKDSGIPAGSDWQGHLYRSLRQCRAMLVICSPNWQKSQWCFAELVYAKMAGKEIFPVIIEDCDLGAVAGDRQGVFVAKLGEEEAYDRVLDSLKSCHLGPDDDFDWDPQECPYPGLMAFEEKHAGVYFGRDLDIQSVRDALTQMRQKREPRFLMIVGASGSGKSSLLKAGILPRLRQKDPNDWLLLNKPLRHASRRRSTESLLDELPAHLVNLYPPDCDHVPKWEDLREQFNDADSTQAAEHFRVAVQNLTIALKCPEATLLLAVDQFEELLQESHDGDTTSPEGRFLAFLQALFSDADNRVLGIGTLRADSYEALEHHPLKITDTYFESYRLGVFPLASIPTVIAMPLQRTKVTMDKELEDQLVADMPDGDSLPLLAFTLEKLFTDYSDDSKLELHEYQDEEKLGGIKGALNQAVREALGSQTLTSEQEHLLRRAFTQHLVQLNDKNEAVRRRSEWSKIEEDAKPLLKHLAEKRLLIIDTDVDEKNPVVEVAHEALFREWEPLKGWIKDNQQILAWRQDVGRDLKSTEKNWSGLSGAQLATARTWPKEVQENQLSKDEQQWISKGMRKLWLLRGLVTVVCLTLTGLTMWALDRQSEAESQAVIAEIQTVIAEIQTAIAKENKDDAVANARKAQVEEGKAWMERADNYKDQPSQQFFGALMAARAMGFQGAGRDKQSKRFKKDFPILFDTGSPNSKKALADFRTLAEAISKPIWSSPATRHHRDSVTSVAYSPDGKTLASASSDKTIKLWNLEEGGESKTLTGHLGWVSSVAFSPDSKTLASASEDTTIKLWNLEEGGEPKTLTGHRSGIKSVAFSPDGKTLASASYDTTIMLWNLEEGGDPKMLTGHLESVTSVAFSPDGKTLASGSRDATIKLWNLEEGGEPKTLAGDQDSIVSVAFSPDGKTLASGSGSWDRTIKLWNLEEGGEPKTLAGHQDDIVSVSFSPDGKTLASGSLDTTIKLWNLEEGGDPETLEGHQDGVESVAFSPDGKTLASGSRDRTIKLWNLEEGGEPKTLTGHRRSIVSVSFSPDGKTLASGSRDQTIKLWNLAEDGEPKTLTGHQSSISSVAFSPDGKTLASGSLDKTIKLWNLEEGGEPKTLTGHKGSVSSVVFSPDGKTLASGSSDNTIKLWNLKEGGDPKTLEGHQDSVKSVAFSPDGKTLASGSSDNTIKLWNLEEGGLPKTFTGHQRFISSVAFSPDGKTLASGSKDATIKLWKPEEGGEPKTLEGHQGGVLSVSFSPDGKTLASGSWDETLKLWNLEEGSDPKTLTGHQVSISSVSFSPDSKTLASGSRDATIKLWNLEGGGEPKTLTGHQDAISSVAFSPDGKTLASGSKDATIKLWKPEEGGEPKTLTGDQGFIVSVSFSPDGKTLASASLDQTIKLWNLEEGGEPKTLAEDQGLISSVSFSPDGKTLASGSWDTIKLWNLEEGGEPKTLTGDQGFTLISFSPDGKTLASGCDSAIKLWNLEEGGEPKTLTGHQDAILSVSFSPDGKTLASGSDDTIKLWNLEEGGEPKTLTGHQDAISSVAFSPDGKTLASGSLDTTIKLWNLEEGGEPKTLAGHQGFTFISFSPDGKTLASGSADTTIKLWNLDAILNPSEINLADYLSQGWLEMDGRKVNWTSDLTNSLTGERKFSFLNVPKDCHIAMSQRGDQPEAFLWQYSRAGNWNAMLAMFPEVTNPSVRFRATARLIRWLRLDSKNARITPGLASFRLQQLTELLGAAVADSEDFQAATAAVKDMKPSS